MGAATGGNPGAARGGELAAGAETAPRVVTERIGRRAPAPAVGLAEGGATVAEAVGAAEFIGKGG